MNDFTKEELEELLAALDYVRDGIDEFIPLNPLIPKIQAMIDNYCEHSESKTIVNYDNDFVQVCVKCGVQL